MLKLAFIFLIIALVAGVFVDIPFLSDVSKQVPFLSDLKPEPPDPAGNLMIDTFAVKGEYVENSKAGDLFVVTGRIKNDYPGARHFINVKGNSKLMTIGSCAGIKISSIRSISPIL